MIDDNDASIVYSTGWASTSDSAAYGGKLEITSTAGSTATMTFSGTSLAVIAPLGPAYGPIRICLDPGVSTAGCTTSTLHSTTTVERDIVYVSGPLAAGSHTIQVTDPSRFADRARRLPRARLTTPPAPAREIFPTDSSRGDASRYRWVLLGPSRIGIPPSSDV